MEVRIDNEGLYYLIAEDANREDQIQELYVQFRSYNRLTDDQRRAQDKTNLLATIARVRQTIKDWQVV